MAATYLHSSAWTELFTCRLRHLFEKPARLPAREPSGGLLEGVDIKLALGTDGQRINLPGGLPIIIDGHCIGGIGVGSGTGEQDLEVAAAAIAAISDSQTF